MTEAYNEAEKLFKREKFDEALKIIDNSRIQAAQSPELWTLKARCLTRLERDDDAFQAASEVFKVGTDNVGIVNTLGEGHMKHGDYDAACEMFLLAEKFVSDRKDKKHFQKKYTKALVAKRKHDKHMGMKKSAAVASTAIASTTKTSSKEAIEESSAKAVEASVPEVAEAEVSINTFPSASSEGGDILEDKHMGMEKSVAVASTAIASATKISTKEAIEESTIKAVEASVPEVAKVEVSIDAFPSASGEGGDILENKHMGMKKSVAVASTAIASTTKIPTKEAIEESTAKVVEASVPEVAEVEVSIDAFPSASSEDKQLSLKKFIAEASSTVTSTTKNSIIKAVEASIPEVTEVEVSINALPEASSEAGASILEAEGASSEPLTKWSAESTFSIHRHLHHDVYEGEVICSLGKLPKTFIEVKRNLPFDKINALQKLAAEEDNILRVDHYAYNPQVQSMFMIVDEVVPVDYYFNCQLEMIRSTVDVGIEVNDANKKFWWKLIVKDFTQILRDVAHGLMSLFSSRNFCGNVLNNIYVTKEKRGKILPCLHVSQKELNKEMEKDIRDFRTKMLSILTLPFSINRFDSVDDLSCELESLISTFHQYKVTPITPAFWIVNHPFFWTWVERMAYILKIKDLLKKNDVKSVVLESCISSYYSFTNWSNHGLAWYSVIGDGVFKDVYEKPMKSGGKVQKYRCCIHIVRYMSACYAHVNDKEYDTVRGGKVYTENEVEGYLRSTFPRIYAELHESFHDYSAFTSIAGELLKNLSSCCYSKKEYYRTL